MMEDNCSLLSIDVARGDRDRLLADVALATKTTAESVTIDLFSYVDQVKCLTCLL